MVSLGKPSNLALAAKDIKDGLASIYIWPMLGWLEIKQRYRRSVLGPLWLTISTGVMVLGMGPLYGRLFNQEFSSYFQYLAISFVFWQFISTLIVESCQAFITAEGYIKQTKLPLSVHVLRVIWKNLIMLGHNMIIIFLVLLYVRPESGWSYLLFPAGVLIIAVNGLWFGLLLGLLCARFRDIPQVITSLVQAALFLTPIMWKAEMLGRHQWVVNFNPIYHFLEIVRQPLTGGMPSAINWYAVMAITLIGYLVMLMLYSRFRARIAYWV